MFFFPLTLGDLFEAGDLLSSHKSPYSISIVSTKSRVLCGLAAANVGILAVGLDTGVGGLSSTILGVSLSDTILGDIGLERDLGVEAISLDGLESRLIH